MSASGNSRGFGVAPRWPLYDGVLCSLRPNAARVYYAVCSHASAQTWQCYPSLDLMARLTGIERSKLHSYLRSLVQVGMLAIVQRGGGHMAGGKGMATVYRVVSDEERTGAKKAPVATGAKKAPVTTTEEDDFSSSLQVPISPEEMAPPIEETEKKNNKHTPAGRAQAPFCGMDEPFSPGSPAPDSPKAANLPAPRPIHSPASPPSRMKGGPESKASAEIASVLASKGIGDTQKPPLSQTLAERLYAASDIREHLAKLEAKGTQTGGMVKNLLLLPPKTAPPPKVEPTAAELAAWELATGYSQNLLRLNPSLRPKSLPSDPKAA